MKTFYLFLLSAILFGCDTSVKPTQTTVVDVDSLVNIDLRNLKFPKNRALNLSEIADSVTFIRLPQNVLLSDVQSINIIDETNEMLIFSNGLVFRYDKNSKYINKVFSSGRGPNDAICFKLPIINSQQKFVTVDDNFSVYYKTFSLTGDLISKQVKSNDKSAKIVVGYSDNFEISYTKNYSNFSTPDSCNIYGNYLMEVKDVVNNKSVYNLPNPDRDFRYQATDKITGVTLIENFLCFDKATRYCYFSIANSDTIYRTTNFADVQSKYYIQLDEPRHDVKSYMMHINGAYDKSKSGYLKSGLSKFTDRYFFMQFMKRSDDTNVCYDNSTGFVVEFDKIKDDIGGSEIETILMMDKLSQHKNKLYYPIDALTILDSGNASKFSGLTENSNPVIMVVHLKK